MSDFRRRLRGAIRNVVVWGTGWAVLGFATNLVMRVTGISDAPVSVLDAGVVGLKVGLGGGIAGAAFSAFIAFVYRNRRIHDISCWRFGVGGAVVTAASMTAFIQGASLLGGGRLVEWEYMVPTLQMFAVFGFGVATTSIKLAQLGASQASDNEPVLLDFERNAPLAGGAGESLFRQRAHGEIRANRD